jgi:hypothetical protein
MKLARKKIVRKRDLRMSSNANRGMTMKRVHDAVSSPS